MTVSRQFNIALLGEDTAVPARLQELLGAQSHQAHIVQRLSELPSAIAGLPPDLIIFCGGPDVESALQFAAESPQHRSIPFLLITQCWDERLVLAGARYGAVAVYASRYENLPLCIPAICLAIDRHAEMRQLHQRTEQLKAALTQARTIGVATGVLMERLRLTRQQAFEVLRRAARTRRTRIGELADALLLTLESVNTLYAVASSPTRKKKREPAHGSGF
jgi:response regulator NasT